EVRESIILFYHSLKFDHLIELEEYLRHSSVFLDSIKSKFDNMEIYSDDFFEYFYAGGYERLFCEQFIVSLLSMSEYNIKSLLEEFDYLNKTEFLVSLSRDNNE